MIDVSVSLTNILIKTAVCLWLLTLTRSILIMFGGSKVFKKANKGEKTAYYPIVNLFTMLEVAEISTYYGILFFIPIINFFVLCYMSIKLGKQFNTGTLYIIGLLFLPIIFYPLLFNSNKEYKGKDLETFKALDNAKNESINLMSQAEIDASNNIVEPESPVIDSVFKGKVETMQEVKPYKAVKIEDDVLSKLMDTSPVEDTTFMPIKRIEPTEQKSDGVSESQEKTPSKFVGELEKKEKVEFIDL